MRRISGLFWLSLGMLGGATLGPSGGCNCPDFEPAAIPRGVWVLTADGRSDPGIFALLGTDSVEVDVGEEYVVLRYTGAAGEKMVSYAFENPNSGSVQPGSH